MKRAYVGTKAILKGRKSGFFVNFGEFPCSWIRIWIRIPNADRDPDPGEQVKMLFFVIIIYLSVTGWNLELQL
jgi:hypothetical protein